MRDISGALTLAVLRGLKMITANKKRLKWLKSMLANGGRVNLPFSAGIFHCTENETEKKKAAHPPQRPPSPPSPPDGRSWLAFGGCRRRTNGSFWKEGRGLSSHRCRQDKRSFLLKTTCSSSQPVVGFFHTHWQLTALSVWVCVCLSSVCVCYIVVMTHVWAQLNGSLAHCMEEVKFWRALHLCSDYFLENWTWICLHIRASHVGVCVCKAMMFVSIKTSPRCFQDQIILKMAEPWLLDLFQADKHGVFILKLSSSWIFCRVTCKLQHENILKRKEVMHTLVYFCKFLLGDK